MPQNLTQIKELLAAYGLQPKHRFGQNFLHDGNQMAKIMAAAAIASSDLVLEVGPGTGALSEWVLAAGRRLVAVEVDRDLEPILQERLAAGNDDRVHLVFADVLDGKHHINPAVLDALRAMSGSTELPPFKLIANLPYNVASPLLVNLAVDYPPMSMGVVMVQREVADRLTAGPGGKDYGPLGITVQAMCDVERVATLSPGCFWPQPQVESAVVVLRRRATPLTADPKALSAMLHRLFSQRRKQIGTILGRSVPLPAGIDPGARPEGLSVSQLIELSSMFPAGRQ